MSDISPEAEVNPIFPDDPFGHIKQPAARVTPPPQEVNRFHERSDVDSSQTAHHHTLGIKHDQASPGDHLHDGRNSKLILEGVTITGASDAAIIQSLISALVSLGATDGT